MKKQAKFLIAVLVVALLVSTLVFASFAIVEKEASINGKQYSTLNEAIANVKPNETIKLERDFVFSETLNIKSQVTIDLNGKTLDGVSYKGKSIHKFYILSGGELNIIGKGKITTDNGSLIFISDGAKNAKASIVADSFGGIEISRFDNGDQAIVDMRAGDVTLDSVKVTTSALYKGNAFAVNNNDTDPSTTSTFNFKNSYLEYGNTQRKDGTYAISVLNNSIVNIDNSQLLLSQRGIDAEGNKSEKSLASINVNKSLLRSNFALYDEKLNQGLTLLINARAYTNWNFADSSLVSSYRVFSISSDTESEITAYFKDSDLVSGNFRNSNIFRGYGDITLDHCNVYNPQSFAYKTVSKTTDGQGLVIKNATSFYKNIPASNATTAYNLEPGMEFVRCGNDRFQYKLSPIGTKPNPYFAVYDDDFNYGLPFSFHPAIFDENGQKIKDAYSDSVNYYPNLSLGSNIKDGIVEVARNNSDNHYYKYYLENPKHNVDPFGMILVDKKYKVKNYSYFTFDFDISTESELPSELQLFVSSRTSDGKSQTQKNTLLTLYVSEDKKTCFFNNSCGNEVYRFENTPFNWQHITYVVQCDSADVTKSLVKIFINGKEVCSNYCFGAGTDYMHCLRWALASNVKANKGENFILDKINIRAFDKGYTGDLAKLMRNEIALENCMESKFTSNYQYPEGLAIAEANGKKYSSIDEAILNANGKIVNLLGDCSKEYFVGQEFTIDTHGFKFDAYSDYYYAQKNGTVIKYIYDDTSDNTSIITWTDRKGSTEECYYPFGSPIRYRNNTLDCNDYVENGFLYEFLGWSESKDATVPDSELISSAETKDKTFYAIYKKTNLAFSATVDGKEVLSFDIEELPVIVGSAKKEVTVVLQSGNTTKNKFTLKIDNGVTLNFDFNGHTLAVEKKSNFIEVSGSAVVNVYSSKQGGRFFNIDSVKGSGAMIYNNGDTATANIGKYKEFDGNNLSVYASCAVDNISIGTVNVDGGNYYRLISDYSGFLVNRKGGSINAKNANFINIWHRNNFLNIAGENCTFTFDNCKFVSAKNTAPMFSSFKAGAKVSFANTTFVGTNLNDGGNAIYKDGCKSDLIFSKVSDGLFVNQVRNEISLNISYTEPGTYNNGFNYDNVNKTLHLVTFYEVSTSKNTFTPITDLLQNLTLYSDFRMNLYIPADSKITGVYTDLSGSLITEFEKVNIDGKLYFVVTKGVNVKDIVNDINFYIVLNDNNIQTVTLNICKYSEAILKSDFSSASKNLIKSMLAYINASSVLFNKSENATVSKLLQTYGKVEQYTNFGETFDVSPLADAILSARLNLDATPDFVFAIKKNFSGTVKLSIGNITKTFTVKEITDESAEPTVIRLENIRIFNIAEKITVTINGTAGGKTIDSIGYYNLATYINNLDMSDNISSDFATALYTYSMYSKEYRKYLGN